MSQLAALRSVFASRVSSLSSRSPVLFATASRRLSTEVTGGGGGGGGGESTDSNPAAASTEQPPTEATPADPFPNSSDGLVYAKMIAARGGGSIGRNTLTTDIVHHFDGCDLTVHDVKFSYNRAYTPVSVLLQFTSRSVFNKALRQAQKRQLYRLETVTRSQWDRQPSFDGKALLLQGVPRNATLEDIERFLCGTNYDPTWNESFLRTGDSEDVRVVLVKFPTQLDARNAFLSKNKNFCLNNPVMIRPLQ